MFCVVSPSKSNITFKTLILLLLHCNYWKFIFGGLHVFIWFFFIFSALPFIEPALAILLKCKMKTLNEQLKMSLIYFCGCFNPLYSHESYFHQKRVCCLSFSLYLFTSLSWDCLHNSIRCKCLLKAFHFLLCHFCNILTVSLCTL